MSCYTISGNKIHRVSSQDKTICGRYVEHLINKHQINAVGELCKYCYRGPELNKPCCGKMRRNMRITRGVYIHFKECPFCGIKIEEIVE